MGRKSSFDQAKADQICARLTEGETLTSICKDMKIGIQTVSDWKKAHPAFDVDFGRARDHGFDAIASRARETARGKGDSDGDVQRDKLIIETDLKLLAKWDPRRYGDKLQLGGDPTGVPITIVSGVPRADD